MAATNGTAPKITLYTNHRCPWAHRAHITIKELGLPYEEVIIDLDKPREPWYLEVNPRGLVPSIKFNEEIITESAVVSQFLADAYPSQFLPASGDASSALKRARINFFVDTWFSKVGSFWIQIARKDTEEEKESLSKEFVAAVAKEIEPLLKNASPFFGGSEKLTLAEVKNVCARVDQADSFQALTAPFILRIYAFAKRGILPQSVLGGLDALPNFSKWASEVVKHPSVTYIWDEEAVATGTLKKIASLKAQAK